MRVCLTFYRTVALPLVTISLICSYLVWQAQNVFFIVPVFWLKIITNIIIGIFIILFRADQFIFFYNLGYTRVKLFVVGFLVDFLIWIFLITIAANMQ